MSVLADVARVVAALLGAGLILLGVCWAWLLVSRAHSRPAGTVLALRSLAEIALGVAFIASTLPARAVALATAVTSACAFLAASLLSRRLTD